MPPFRRVLVTGPPLNGRDEYLEKVVEKLKNLGVIARIYKVFDYMRIAGKQLGHPNITKDNILDLPEPLLRELRARALNLIDSEIRNDRNTMVHIISTPNVFIVRPHGLITTPITYGIDYDLVETYIDPDIVIVTLDDLVKVRERIKKDPVWSKRIVNPGLELVANWRQEAINNALRIMKLYYERTGKHLRVIQFSVNHPPEIMAELIRNVKPRIYMSYNMTGLPEESFNNVMRFYNKLSKYFVAFDPGTIRDWEIISGYDEILESGEKEYVVEAYRQKYVLSIEEIERAIDLIRAQVVSRDFNYVHNADAIVVYHHAPYPSYGVMAEVIEASRTGRPVYVLYPYRKRLSPFFEHYVYSSYRGEERIVSYRNYPVNEVEELEDILINKMINDACSNRWTTWSPAKEYIEQYCI